MSVTENATRLDASVPIAVLEPMRRVNAALLDLLRSFSDDEWAMPTVHRDRSVKDLTAHLLQGSLGRVSSLRDRYWRQPERPLTSTEDLVALIQDNNRAFMRGVRWVSPTILIELIALFDPQVVAAFERLDPDALGLGVAWAGERASPNWFDVAREYTEKWHHQQQLRDATARPALYAPPLLTPALETFARGLPFAYRAHEVADGTGVTISTTGAVSLAWTLRRADRTWSLWNGSDPRARSSISIPAETAWRLWTKSVDPGDARRLVHVVGHASDAEPLIEFTAIMA